MTAIHTPPAPVSSPPGDRCEVIAQELITMVIRSALDDRDDEAAIRELDVRLAALEMALKRGRDVRAVLLARRWHAGRTLEWLADFLGLSTSRVDQLVKRGCQLARLPGKRTTVQGHIERARAARERG